MPSGLSNDELDVAFKLRQKGVAASVATAAVVFATREHARPERELRDILRQYQGLEDPPAVDSALAGLKIRHWVAESESYGQVLLHQAPNLRTLLASFIGEPEAEEHLSKLRQEFESRVCVLGSMNDEYVYASYLDLLSRAQREIILPMLATSPNLSSVPIIQDRARKGVKVRILLGSPEVVAELRGGPMKHMASDAIQGWARHAKGIRNIQVRIAHRADDILTATCMVIDKTLLRFDIYDPHRERSLQGTMIEVTSLEGFDLNLIHLFLNAFDLAWRRASPTGKIKRFFWRIRQHGYWIPVGIFIIVSILARDSPVPLAIASSAAGSFLVAALISDWAGLRGFVRRIVVD